MSEIAVVSSRKARLQKLADDDSPGAQSALALHSEPSTFLSTVQVGITTVGISRQQCALIVDEYGELQGLVTLTDVLTSIVGELPSSDIHEEQDIVTREDGFWLIDGSVTIERLKSALKIEDDLSGEEENAFNTLGAS